MKKSISLVSLFMFLLFISLPSKTTLVYDNEPITTLQEMSTYLESLGTPIDTLNDMSSQAKQTIYSVLKDHPDAIFIFRSPSQFVDLQAQQNSEESEEKAIISSSDLKLGATIYQMGNSNDYTFFPEFTWTKNSNISNDHFGFALNAAQWNLSSSGFLDIYVSSFGLSDSFRYDRPASGSFSAEDYVMDGINSATYTGIGVLYAFSTTTNPTKQIRVSYAQDSSVLNNTTINVSFGIFDISYSGGSSMNTASVLVNK